jgi:hypothetical protein
VPSGASPVAAALPADYAARLQRCLPTVAHGVATEGDAVCAVALWRVIENTYEGRRLYVDDLVTDEGIVRGVSGKCCSTGWRRKARSSAAMCWRSIPGAA